MFAKQSIVSTSISDSLDISSASFTVELWFRLYDSADTIGLFVMGSGSNSNEQLKMSVLDSRSLLCSISDDSDVIVDVVFDSGMW